MTKSCLHYKDKSICAKCTPSKADPLCSCNPKEFKYEARGDGRYSCLGCGKSIKFNLKERGRS